MMTASARTSELSNNFHIAQSYLRIKIKWCKFQQIQLLWLKTNTTPLSCLNNSLPATSLITSRYDLVDENSTYTEKIKVITETLFHN